MRKALAPAALAAALVLAPLAPAHAGHSIWIDKIKPSSIACAIWSGWC